MDPLPKVAIVMPYYNEPELLIRSVVGVMEQTYNNWKLFVVDDGSVDKNKADYHIVKSRHLKIIYKLNGGVSSARNTALDHIQAERGFTHIAYCDADDVWDTMHLEESLNALNVLEADMTYSTPEFKMIDGSVAFPFGIPFYETYPGIEALLRQNFIYISSVVCKIECLKVGQFDGEVNSLEDWDMWLRIAKAGFKIEAGLLKFPSFAYTVKPNGNGSKRTDEIYQRVLKKHSA